MKTKCANRPTVHAIVGPEHHRLPKNAYIKLGDEFWNPTTLTWYPTKTPGRLVSYANGLLYRRPNAELDRPAGAKETP